MKYRLSKSQKAAIQHFKDHALKNKANSIKSIEHILKMCNIDDSEFLLAYNNIKNNARILCHFHPDRYDLNENTVASSLLQSGRYMNQFETLISNGSVSAYEGGDRDIWERLLYGDAFHQGEFLKSERAKYGVLDLIRNEYGAAPRFGSCYFVLKNTASLRSTFTYQDSHTLPDEKGTIDEFDYILSALLTDIFTSNSALGEKSITVPSFLSSINNNLKDDLVFFNKKNYNLNHYIEAQIHGEISLKEDVDYLVIDPSFSGTDVAKELLLLSTKYDIKTSFHRGYKVSIENVPKDFRGENMPHIARQVANGNAFVTPNMIGDATRSLDKYTIFGPTKEILQELKHLWHVLVAFNEN